jgi:hypothetical protein
MNFKLSQTQKDYFDIIRTYGSVLSILTVSVGIFVYAIDKTLLEKFFFEHKIWAFVLAFGLIAFPFIVLLFTQWINRFILKKRKLSNIIIERQDVIIDILGNGEEASYFERMCFYKIGKINNKYQAKLRVSGKIDSDSIHASNCFYNLNHEKTKLTIFYINNKKKLNNYPSLINRHETFLMYSATLKDTFTEEEEYWDLLPVNYCLFYNITIIFPEGKQVIFAKLFKKVDNKLTELEDLSPIIVRENNRVKIILQISDYDYGDFLSLKWKLSK